MIKVTVDVIKLRIFRWGDDVYYPGGPKHPHEMETEKSDREEVKAEGGWL